MKKNSLKIALLCTLLLLLLSAANDLLAQCPMCKASLESNLDNGGKAGRGINAGILYMLVAPYLLVASVGFWWWKNKKKEDAEAAASDSQPENAL